MVEPSVTTGDETARLVRRIGARVRDDLVADSARERDALRGYSPPAIAGITMTSLPSGTGADNPPFARASSSPM